MSEGQQELFGGSWTVDKLEILAKYLHEYNKALKNQPFTRFYVDAFAGTGYRQQRRNSMRAPSLFDEIDDQAQDFLKGSAKLALEVDPPFHRFVFIESDEKKAEELRLLGREHPDRGQLIRIVNNEANTSVQEFCAQMSPMDRAVVFLDPFATETRWETIEQIAATKKIDVWIWFPLMAVNRLLADDPKAVWRDALDRVFGTREWFRRFYRNRTESDIFGKSFDVVERACDTEGIGAFFLERLRSVFAEVAPNPRIFPNSKNAPLFQLFFAAGNAKGASIAVRIAQHLLKAKEGR